MSAHTRTVKGLLGTFVLALLTMYGGVPSHASNLTDCIRRRVTFDGISRLDYATVKVSASPRLYLHARYPNHCTSGNQKACPASAYLVRGDAVAVGKICRKWDYVQYIGEQRVSEGWVDSIALTLTPPPPPPKPPTVRIGTRVYGSPPPRQYTFHLTMGRGTPVCEAYLQRLNQTAFYNPPYCGRPESTLVPGFALLHRKYLSVDEFKALYVDAADLLDDKPPHYPFPPLMGNYRGFTPGAWTYEPAVNLENSGSGDNVLLWTDTDRNFDPYECGAPDLRYGNPIRAAESAIVISADGSLNRKKTYETFRIFGEGLSSRHRIRVDNTAMPVDVGVFRYRNLNYFDTFLSMGAEYAPGPEYASWRRAADTLAVFLVRQGNPREMCEYYVPDLRTSQ